MSLSPFFAAPLAIQIHLIAAICVAVLTPFQFWGFRKGSTPHRVTGYFWLGAMVVVAISSFFIPTFMRWNLLGFGWIHLLSIYALYSVVQSIWFARAHRIDAHRKTLIWLAIGFWIAAGFTLLPSRILGRIAGGG